MFSFSIFTAVVYVFFLLSFWVQSFFGTDIFVPNYGAPLNLSSFQQTRNVTFLSVWLSKICYLIFFWESLGNFHSCR